MYRGSSSPPRPPFVSMTDGGAFVVKRDEQFSQPTREPRDCMTQTPCASRAGRTARCLADVAAFEAKCVVQFVRMEYAHECSSHGHRCVAERKFPSSDSIAPSWHERGEYCSPPSGRLRPTGRPSCRKFTSPRKNVSRYLYVGEPLDLIRGLPRGTIVGRLTRSSPRSN